jgi:hypothetical protein
MIPGVTAEIRTQQLAKTNHKILSYPILLHD